MPLVATQNEIDKAFADLLERKDADAVLGITKTNLYTLRSRFKDQGSITLDKKLELLKKSGWREDAAEYSRKDLLDAVKFTIKTSAKAREFGAEYVLEKWKASKKK